MIKDIKMVIALQDFVLEEAFEKKVRRIKAEEGIDIRFEYDEPAHFPHEE